MVSSGSTLGWVGVKILSVFVCTILGCCVSGDVDSPGVLVFFAVLFLVEAVQFVLAGGLGQK